MLAVVDEKRLVRRKGQLSAMLKIDELKAVLTHQTTAYECSTTHPKS